MKRESPRRAFVDICTQAEERLVGLVQVLVRIPTPNPPGDTTRAAAAVHDRLAEIEGVQLERYEPRPGCVNLNAELTFARPGRSLVFNGHLDTFPVGDEAAWTRPPFAAVLEDGRLYGRGVTDMKAGVACQIVAFEALAAARAHLRGRVVLSLVGDEETGGAYGTRFLLDHVPNARGDAVLSADVGAPGVLRFGEKGCLWVELEALGRATHAAHPHLGTSAIERLMDAIRGIKDLERLPVAVPDQVRAAIDAARDRSESISGAGEGDNLARVTVNVGTVAGGLAFNLVADRAHAGLDVRIPAGLTAAEVERQLAARVGDVPGVSYRLSSTFDPTWTSPDHEIVRLALANAREAGVAEPVANYRLGFSDLRFYRALGIPAVLCGPTLHNLGAPDEYVELSEIAEVFRVHALTAFDYLRA